MERIERARADFLLILIIAVTVGTGLVFLFSTSYGYSAKANDGDSLAMFLWQLLIVGGASLCALLLSFVPLEEFRRHMPLILLVTILVTLLPFVPGLGRKVLGARRWINVFGRTFQPAELVKLVLPLYLASYLSGREGPAGRTLRAVLPPFLVTFLLAMIVYLQNDYSSAVFIIVVALSVFFFANVRLSAFIALAVASTPLAAVLLFAREYRVKRILAFLGSQPDEKGFGYQAISAQSAFLGGGFWGKGFGLGVQKIGALPEAHSDFIYAVIGEETGFLGAVFVLSLFLLIAWRGYTAASRSTDPFASILAFGLTTTILLQALLNMMVATGLLPTTGITLPFFSQGGSSILVVLAMCGILVNLTRRAPCPAS